MSDEVAIALGLGLAAVVAGLIFWAGYLLERQTRHEDEDPEALQELERLVSHRFRQSASGPCRACGLAHDHEVHA